MRSPEAGSTIRLPHHAATMRDAAERKPFRAHGAGGRAIGPPHRPHDPHMAAQDEAAPTFEAALAELEDIVARMESGALPLKESLAAYQRGAVLLQYCQHALKDAQMQVEVLEKDVLK